MNLYLAGGEDIYRRYMPEPDTYKGASILQSFYYANEFTESVVIKNARKFMLDSGAFTFMQKSKQVNWNEYLAEYADFINRNGVELFFELDIDDIVGYDNVLKLRRELERLTGKKPIPVWHYSRGKEEFVKMCKEYPYVAIGGLVAGGGEYSRKHWRVFPWFIDTAHKHGAKIHALGFTSLEAIKKYKFDSVDSASWTTGNRFSGTIFQFNGAGLSLYRKPAGKRIKDHGALARRNWQEWIKFQKYAENNL